MQLCTFFIGDRRYGIDAARVGQIVRLGPVTPVPLAPGAVEGVAAHRGDVVAVLDLAATAPASGLAVVIRHPRGEFCLRIDRPGDVAEVTPADAVPGTGGRAAYRVGDGIVEILEPDGLVA
jgi:purine-binding chemotaxis protein CheW